MNELEEEKGMVRKMKDSGMSLAQVAAELDKSISWVYSRYNEHYAPAEVKEKVVISEIDRVQLELDDIKNMLSDLEKEEVKIEEEINSSPFRTYEELEKYRKERDKDVKAPGAVPSV